MRTCAAIHVVSHIENLVDINVLLAVKFSPFGAKLMKSIEGLLKKKESQKGMDFTLICHLA